MLNSGLVQSVPYRSLFPYSKQPDVHSHDTLSIARKFAQGAGSALLVFAGADTMTSNAAAGTLASSPPVDFSSLEGVFGSLFSGQLTGPLQIIVAILVFLAAGQCIARFFGLVAAGLVIFLYLQGVTIEDALVFLQHFGERLSAAAYAFMNADVTGVANASIGQA